MFRFEKLEVWNEEMKYASKVYDVTGKSAGVNGIHPKGGTA